MPTLPLSPQLTQFEDSFSEEVWSSTYKDHTDIDINSTLYRVASAVAAVEKTPELQQEWTDKFYKLLTQFTGTAGGRIYANAGTSWGGTTMLNCFVGPRVTQDADSLDGILTHLRSQAHTLKAEGGWGENFSYIRPRGAFIHGVGVETPGAVKYMELFDKASEIITSGSGKKSTNKKAKGKIRKGAMMAVLDVWHPDIIEFITAKQQPGRLTKFNISVNCTDAFMDRVMKIQELETSVNAGTRPRAEAEIEMVMLDSWDLIFPDTTCPLYKTGWQGDIKKWREAGNPIVVYNTISVKWLWNLIMESTYNRAEPGVLFLDRANYFLPLNYAETAYATNPCGEQVLAPGGVCNLGSLNLTQFVNDGWTDFDYEKIVTYTQYMVRFLDDINDLTNAPLPEYKTSLINKRRVGVGILGWGSALYMLQTRFASSAAALLRDKVMSTIARTAYQTSIDLAIEKGMFPLCDPIKHAQSPFIVGLQLSNEYMEKLRITGIRNSSLLSVQPTGNTSILANVVSGGLEPVFMHEYIRTVIVNHTPEGMEGITPKWYEGEWRETEIFKFAKEGDEEILRGEFNGVVYKIDKNRGLTKEVLCEDYGVRHMKRANKWDPLSDWAVTAMNLSVDDHVNDLMGFAQWVDSSMSKCVAEGTLISTNRGIKPIESLGNHLLHQEGFVDPVDSYTVLDENGHQKTITSHYFGGEKQCMAIRFNNGFELTAALTHKLKCDTGWKSIRDIQVGDKVFYRTNAFVVDRPYVTPPLPTFAANAKHTTFPSVVDEDFALLLGMWVADGSLTDHSISMCEKNEMVGDICQQLMTRCFSTHHEQLDDRWGVRTHFVHSSSIARWFKQEFGHGAENKRIPQWLLDSPVSVWVAFMEGLTLDGYLKTNKYNTSLVLFDGYAKDVAEKITYMLSTMGVQYHLSRREVGDGKITYGVTAWLEDSDTIVPIEDHKRTYNTRGKTHNQTFVSSEVFEQLIASQPNNTYGSIMRARLRKCQSRGNFIRMSFLKKTGIVFDENLTCVVVTDVVDAGMRKVYDIEVEDTHSYLINGVVSHNTINVPNDYPFEDFKQIYTNTYKSGVVKGVTTYRSGTMTTVLSAKEESGTDDEEVILDDVDLPDSLPAVRKKLRAENRKWYMTVSFLNDRPVEFFVQTNHHEKTATTHDAVDRLLTLAREKNIPERHVFKVSEKISGDNNVSKLARCISFLLRHGVLIRNVVRELDRVEHVYAGSFLFAIRKYLASFIKDGEKITGEQCQECGSSQVIYSEGCHKCVQCGSSKCG